MAGVYFDFGRFSEALKLYHHAHDLQPLNPDYLIGRAGALVSLGRAAEALPDYHTALTLRAGDPDALLGRAIAWDQLGHFVRMGADLAELRRVHRETPGEPRGPFCPAAVEARERVAQYLSTPIELTFD